MEYYLLTGIKTSDILYRYGNVTHRSIDVLLSNATDAVMSVYNFKQAYIFLAHLHVCVCKQTTYNSITPMVFKCITGVPQTQILKFCILKRTQIGIC